MAIPEGVEAAVEELCRRVYALAKADLSEPWTMRSDRIAVAESFRDAARAALVQAIEQTLMAAGTPLPDGAVFCARCYGRGYIDQEKAGHDLGEVRVGEPGFGISEG